MATRTARWVAVAAILATRFAAIPARAGAQSLRVGDAREEYLRVLQVAGKITAGSFTVRPIKTSTVKVGTGTDPWGLVSQLPATRDTHAKWTSGWGAESRTYLNSAFPVVQNDGAVWQGRGLTTALDLGGDAGWGPLSMSLRPTLVYSQNRSFTLPLPAVAGDAKYRDPWASADLPVRMGPDPLAILDPGQTSVRVARYGLSFGGGTENLWWGPGVQNALLLTDNAAGFLHADLRTDRPLDLGFGKVEAQWIWGRLDHTKWFNDDTLPQYRFFTGAVLSYTPKVAPGLTLGISRAFTEQFRKDWVTFTELFLIVQRVEKKVFDTPGNQGGGDRRDQLASLFGRWVFPEVGFEAYGEWGRNDHGTDFREYFLEPEHSSAYVLGLRKVTECADGALVSVNAEVTHLERDKTWTVRETPTWYTHSYVPQGYTQRGQVIGSGVGPGGDSQYLGADLYHTRGRLGVFVQRRTINNDAFYDQTIPLGVFPHRTALDFGGTWHRRMSHGLEMDAGAMLTREYNRYYIDRNDVWNAQLQAAIRWRLN